MRSFRCLFSLILITALSSSCISLGRKGPEHFYFGSYSEAEKYYNAGNYEKAIDNYGAYLEDNPDGNLAVIATYYLGKSHAALGNKDEAKMLYQSIIKDYPDLVWAKFSQTQLQELEFESSAS